MPDCKWLSIDESLIRCQTRSPHLVFMPLKPGKWGLLLRCCCTLRIILRVKLQCG